MSKDLPVDNVDNQNIPEMQFQKPTLQSIIGTDINTDLFTKMLVKNLYNDTLNISRGGQDISSNSVQVVVKPQIENSLLISDTLAVVYRIYHPSALQKIINNVASWKAISAKIGNSSFSYQFPEYYNQFQLSWTNQSELEGEDNMLGIGEFDENSATLVSSDANVFSLAQPYSSGGVGITGAGYTYLIQTLFNQYGIDVSFNNSDCNVMVPLKYIYPEFFKTLGKYIFIKNPGDFQLTMQTMDAQYNCFKILQNTANAYVNSTAVASYTLNNMQLYYEYAPISSAPQIVSGIFGNEFEYFLNSQYCIPVQMASNVTLTFGVGQGVLKGFSFGVVAQSQNRTQTLIHTQDTYYAPHYLFAEQLFYPQIPIKQITFNSGRENLTITNNGMAFMQNLQNSNLKNKMYPNEPGPLRDGIVGKMQFAYYFDLTRYAEFDSFGSTTSGQMIISIQFDQTQDIGPFAVTQTVNGSLTPFGGTSLTSLNTAGNYQVYGFLDFEEKHIMQNGIMRK